MASFQKNLRVVLLTLCGFMVVTACASAPSGDPNLTEADDGSFSMADVTCWELLTTNAEDSVYATTMFYGYVAGTRGEPAQSPSKVEAVVAAMVDTCSARPSKTVVDAFNENWRTE
jgi:hypothetical protein